MLWLMYWLNYLDRNAITLARLNGFQKDLGLTSSQYSTAISILFVGYILGQVSNFKTKCMWSQVTEHRVVKHHMAQRRLTLYLRL
jgi:hypothetical protein